MNIENNVGLSLERHAKIGGRARQGAAPDVAGGMTKDASKMQSEISGGMKRARLGARSRLDPDILLFDEPTAGLVRSTAKR